MDLKNDLPVLLILLLDGNEKVRKKADMNRIKLGLPENLKEIYKKMSTEEKEKLKILIKKATVNPAWETKVAAVRAISEFQLRDMLPELILLLQESNLMVKKIAEEAREKFNLPKEIEEIRSLLSPEENKRLMEIEEELRLNEGN